MRGVGTFSSTVAWHLKLQNLEPKTTLETMQTMAALAQLSPLRLLSASSTKARMAVTASALRERSVAVPVAASNNVADHHV